MNEKWYGEGCKYQICKFEKDSDGIEDRSQPLLVYCNNEENKKDCEGNCNTRFCPIK